jgi:KUP system potassium uptake protein
MDDQAKRGLGRAALVVAALGVVFGDIGTSPIYTVQTAFNPGDPHPISASLDHVYGVVSLIFWAVTLIVTVKYVGLVMSADDDGEGGIMALISQVRKTEHISRRSKILLSGLGVFGAALFFGDSMITPAISVLSAVEGTKTIEPSMDKFVVPITVVFGPIMLIWFTTIGVLGVRGITMHPEVLKALSPTYAADFMLHGEPTGFFALTAVVLAFTGVEALYADMGHFGRPAIASAWLILVFPACILSYLGQGALILDNPDTIAAPFFRLMPHGGLIPLVLLATAATVIASQAVISGAFSIARQAAQLGYLPRLRVIHTSEREYGQVYVPVINWLLLVAVLGLVLAFRSSAKLAFAYGTAVTGTILCTTVLFFVIARHRWHRPLWQVLIGAGFFLIIELAFFASNLTKIAHGAWLPILIGIVLFTVMVTWFRGRYLVTQERLRVEGPLPKFIEGVRRKKPPVTRVPGTAIFLNRGKETAPLSMWECVEHLHSLHEHALILSLETLPVPRIPDSQRLEIDDLGHPDDGISFVRAKHGYFEEFNVPHIVRLVAKQGVEGPLDVRNAAYFLSKVELKPTDKPGMSLWRKRLFLATAVITAEPADYFRLPRNRTVILGSNIEF